MVTRKLDGAVDESSGDRKIHKWDATVHNLLSYPENFCPPDKILSA